MVLLGQQVRKDLRLPVDPQGRFVEINDTWFKIIGTMESRGEIFGLNQDGFVLIPYEIALALNGASAEPDLWITFAVRDPGPVAGVSGRVAALLRRLHHWKPSQPDDFAIDSAGRKSSSTRTRMKHPPNAAELIFNGLPQKQHKLRSG